MLVLSINLPKGEDYLIYRNSPSSRYTIPLELLVRVSEYPFTASILLSNQRRAEALVRCSTPVLGEALLTVELSFKLTL